jgi:hypothetical protein
MTSFKNWTTKVALPAITGLVLTAAGATTAGASHRYTVEVKCSGAYDAYVVDWPDAGLALYIYEGDDLVHAAWAEKRVIETGSIERVGYKTGSILEGGADLRIRTKDERIPANEGYANLSFNHTSPLLKCTKY